MTSSRPGWVAQELMSILGLDDETVKQVIIPDFEGYTGEVKLRSHLQDFLGTTPAAKTFATRYLSLRFPSITPQVPQSAPLLKPQPQPQAVSSTSDSSTFKSKKSKSTGQTPSGLAPPPPPSIPEALNAAFGPGGKIYQKNRDDVPWSSKATPTGSGSHTPIRMGGSASASGSGHPRQPAQRSGGALVIHEVKKGSRVDDVPQGMNGNGKKGKEKEKIWDLPKSKEVKRLEGIIEDLKIMQSGEGKIKSDEEAIECFCQARLHPLSPYTPQCAFCGLIQCNLQKPNLPCASCHRPLLTSPQISRLLSRLDADIAAQLSIEQSKRDERERERLERLRAESGGGSFPVLPTGVPAGKGVPEGRKVLTLGGGGGKGKGKAVLTTTYTRAAPAPPAESGNQIPSVTTVGRPRSAPPDDKKVQKEWEKAVAIREGDDRPWGGMRSEDVWEYVESRVVDVVVEGGGRRRNAKKKRGGGVGMDGRVVVGAV